MHFENTTKNAKSSKISQDQAIGMIMNEKDCNVCESTMKNPLNVFYR